METFHHTPSQRGTLATLQEPSPVFYPELPAALTQEHAALLSGTAAEGRRGVGGPADHQGMAEKLRG